MEPAEPRNDREKRNSREVTHPVAVLPDSARWKVDTEHVLGLTGIVSTFLNLVVVVLVYIYTPV